MSALQHTTELTQQVEYAATEDACIDVISDALGMLPAIEQPLKRASDKAALASDSANEQVVNTWAKQQVFRSQYTDPVHAMGYFPAQTSGDFEKLDALDSDLAEKFLFLDIFVQRLQDSPNARRWKMIGHKINRHVSEILIRYTDGTTVKMLKNTLTNQNSAVIQSKHVKRLCVDLDSLSTAI